LKADRELKVEVLETPGLIGQFRFNQLFPPFDNRRIRRAVLSAVIQREYMTAVAGEGDPTMINDHVGFFAPSSVYANDAGMEVFSPDPDMAALKKEILAAGYNGEKIVFLGAADVPRITAICQVGADMLTRLGMNVEYQSLDWGTIVQRGYRQNPIGEGGWSILGSMTGGLDWDNPASSSVLRGAGKAMNNGWAVAPKLEELRDRWLRAPDLASQKALAVEVQRQAFIDVPMLPLGLYYQPAAFRGDLTGMLKGLNLFTGVRRG
jgi:peptide/nickel transport system substrate-binding protein